MRTYFDCSGSMPRSAFGLAPEETDEFYLFDTHIHGPYDRIRGVDALQKFCGGTDYARVWKHLEENPADTVVVITDGYGPDLDAAPANVKIILVSDLV